MVSRQFDLLEYPRIVFRREEHFNLKAKLGVTVGYFDSACSTVEIKHHLIELTSFSHICPIADEAFRLSHVAGEEKASLHFVRWIFIGRSR